MRVILKYHFPERSMTVKLPPGSVVLNALTIPFNGVESVFLVVEQDANTPATEPRTFVAIPAGDPFSKRAMRFVDTVVLRRGATRIPTTYVMSIFEELGA